MINSKVFDVVWGGYNPETIPFLSKLRHRMTDVNPYSGLKVFHNIPLTLEAVLKIDLLLLGGADVTASCVEIVPPNKKAIDILNCAHVPICLDKKINKHFDIHLDCCAELRSLTAPSIGAVELTQTGTKIYKEFPLNYPLISVDDCLLKHLETIGTGHSCAEALRKLTKSTIEKKKFIVFGYGKVGRGVVKALKKYSNNIIIVEEDKSLIDQLVRSNLNAMSTSLLDDLKKELKDTFCIITATGIEGCISKYFDKKELSGIYLANMGAVDEFGYKFTDADVLFSKKPINFATNEPTLLRYLDPVLYAHNISLDLLLSKEFSNGYHQFPESLSMKIINEWAQIHNEEISEIFAI